MDNAAPSDKPSHTGLLRDETVALRWLFGYHDSTPKFPGPCLSGTRLQKTEMMDVIFFSIDIDSLHEDEQTIQQVHIGISTLDTRSLQAFVMNHPDGAKPVMQMIESHHFVIGNSKFKRKKSKQFLFGPFETLTLSGFKAHLDTLTSHRDIVLVFHGGDREQWVLKRLNINIQPLCIIDTVKAAQYPLQLSYRYSLEKLLHELGIPFINLHIAGNDAHFVLRCLLMIAVRDAERHADTSAPPDWLLSTFRKIAQAPRPLFKAEVEGLAMSRQRK
ncbi:hypothetical protein PT974_05560 [Cladobotryum mycophilum]|uniref:Gfd2/YDR514C-like C-terminal domain-containing protein n=1 Tax=Cladobotryum mycophilum TaxID=491253 RepID=A0ABR0SK73_9HYPO